MGGMNSIFLFKVIDAGREYVIFADGTIEGFGKDAIVFNQFICHAEEYHSRRVRSESPRKPYIYEPEGFWKDNLGAGFPEFSDLSVATFQRIFAFAKLYSRYVRERENACITPTPTTI